MSLNKFVEEYNCVPAFEYIRGSHAYGIAIPESDIDYGGVYICPEADLFGLRDHYVEQVSDDRYDTTYYELSRWVELLIKSNPNALEGLFIPERCIVGDVHPAIQAFRNNADLFLSKRVFDTIGGYAISQIYKARGLNKKIVNPIEKRKDVLDFCFTFWKQGSKPIKEWLNEHNMIQERCGLVNVPNMTDCYSVFYDFDGTCNYRGIISPESSKDESNEVRLSAVPDKNAVPVCYMTFNKNAYILHCKEYKEYRSWVENRNPSRYNSTLDKNYDGKNMAHCVRMLRMGTEIASGMGFNVDRSVDRDLLLAIRNHEMEYDEILRLVNDEKAKFEKSARTSTLQDTPDIDKINKLLIEQRKNYYGHS